jgi:hypothetical protein
MYVRHGLKDSGANHSTPHLVLCNPKNPGCRDEKYIKILLRHRREPGWRNIYFADPAYPDYTLNVS